MSSIRRPVLLFILIACVALAALVLLRSGEALGRTPAVPLEDMVEAQVVGVGQMPGHPFAVVLLRVPGSDEPVPIFVGLAEAEAIGRARDEVRPPRPLTHELGLDLVEASGAQIQRLVIDEIRDGAYLAALELKLRDRRGTVWIDARPSDGLALALRHQAPILLSLQVVETGTRGEPTVAPDAHTTSRGVVLSL